MCGVIKIRMLNIDFPFPDLLARNMSSEPASKRACMMKIGTHNGTFHCDEVFACFMLKQLPQFENAEIVRCV
jgi:hypothetical protein